jgi:diguanylate cyclase (GGDEF)-like protein
MTVAPRSLSRPLRYTREVAMRPVACDADRARPRVALLWYALVGVVGLGANVIFADIGWLTSPATWMFVVLGVTLSRLEVRVANGMTIYPGVIGLLGASVLPVGQFALVSVVATIVAVLLPAESWRAAGRAALSFSAEWALVLACAQIAHLAGESMGLSAVALVAMTTLGACVANLVALVIVYLPLMRFVMGTWVGLTSQMRDLTRVGAYQAAAEWPVVTLAAYAWIVAPLSSALLIPIAVMVHVVSKQNALLLALNERLAHDELTGVRNREGFLEAVAGRMSGAPTPSVVAMADIDDFKLTNDTVGHAAGDQVLKDAAHALADVLGAFDGLVGRYGGEEFVMWLPLSAEAHPRTVLDEARSAVEKALAASGRTISIGFAQLAPGDDIHDAVARADDALYEAKRRGKNQVIASAPAVTIAA